MLGYRYIIKKLFGISTKNKITTEDRLKDLQIDLKHMKTKLDVIAYYMQQIDKNGLKIKVKKWQ